jgi:hypothetical protein
VTSRLGTGKRPTLFYSVDFEKEYNRQSDSIEHIGLPVYNMYIDHRGRTCKDPPLCLSFYSTPSPLSPPPNYLGEWVRYLCSLFFTLSLLCVAGRACLSQLTVDGGKGPSKTTFKKLGASSCIFPFRG